MESKEFEYVCTEVLKQYLKQYIKDVPEEVQIYTVWSCKTLQNNKALMSTSIPDTRYYEFTYNGDKKELYMDSYLKEANVLVEITEKDGETYMKGHLTFFKIISSAKAEDEED